MNHNHHKGGDTLYSSHPLNAVFEEAMHLQESGHTDQAQIRYREILNFDPEHAPSLHMMGIIAYDLGKMDIAEELIRKSIKINTKDFSSHNSLGNVLQKTRRYEAAITSYKRTITLAPNFPHAYNNIGVTFLLMEKTGEALKYFKKAETISRNLPETLNNLGIVLRLQGNLDESTKYFEQAIQINPDYTEALNNIGNNYRNQHKPHQAISYYKRALALNPNSAETLIGLGITLRSAGFLDEAVAHFKRAIEIQPTVDRFGNTLMAMIYAESVTPEELAATARKFGEIMADPLIRVKPLMRDITPNRKLRIGYVSPDFNDHVVHYFFEPLLTFHNKKDFEVFGYYNSERQDFVSARLKQKFDHFRNIIKMTDDQATDLIEADKIDILIDLAGHTANNRLLIFARKPAPIQATWLGFPATSGMKAMDYRITDAYAEPISMTESLNTETLWRLPNAFCCYQPHIDSPAVIDHSPFEKNGYITFGCFNNFYKVTDKTLEVWAKIMQRVPQSQLLLEIANIDVPQFRSDTEARMQKLGLPMNRVILELRKPENQFTLYNKIDIALDPFPCVGGTTSMDTLWMGVPFVTLAGRHFTSRMGVSILTNAGLSELVAQDVDQYIRLATDLANDHDRLRKIRHNLRDRVTVSPLMNQENFTRNMETAYRQMWEIWCEKNKTA